jgi:hypothetical protein
MRVRTQPQGAPHELICSRGSRKSASAALALAVAPPYILWMSTVSLEVFADYV